MCTDECTSPAEWDELIKDRLVQLLDSSNEKVNVLDVGANLGVFTTNAARHSNTKCVYAVEPSCDTFTHLLESLKLQKVADKCKAINAAVSDMIGKIDLYSGNGMSETFNIIGDKTGETKLSTVDCVTLDYLSERLGINFDVVKVDVEGAEMLVLKGGIKTVGNSHAIMLEVHTNDTFKELLQMSKQNNWNVFCLKNLHSIDLSNPSIEFCYQVLIVPQNSILLQTLLK